MNQLPTQQELDHQTAITWITTELQIFAQNVGQRNAASAVLSVLNFATVLRLVSLDEKQAFAEEINRITEAHFHSLRVVA